MEKDNNYKAPVMILKLGGTGISFKKLYDSAVTDILERERLKSMLPADKHRLLIDIEPKSGGKENE